MKRKDVVVGNRYTTRIAGRRQEVIVVAQHDGGKLWWVRRPYELIELPKPRTSAALQEIE